MKTQTTLTRLSAAVLAGTITFTGLGLASPAFAAPGASAPGIEAASYTETLTANVISSSGTGYGVESILYQIDAYAGDDHILTGENVFHTGPDNANHTRAYTFSVKLTDQPQVITQLVAKHKDNLAGADKLVVLENPLVIPAHQPFPDPVLDTRITVQQVEWSKDDKGYDTFFFDKSKVGTTTTELERDWTPNLYEVWVDGKYEQSFSVDFTYRCDDPRGFLDGKSVEIRAYYNSVADRASHYNSTTFDCTSSIPLALRLGQETTSVKPGDTVAFTIDEAAGTYGLKDPVISWSVDGKTVEGATGLSFKTPDAGFTAIQASVTIADREGEKLTRTVGWANPTPGTGGGTDKPDTDTGKPGTKPDTGSKPGKPDAGVDIDKDDSDSPYKSECEGLCDKGDAPSKPDDDKDIVDVIVSKKPLTGFKKPVQGIDNPRVMSTLIK